MTSKKHSTNFVGVRYRNHKTRKYNGRQDRYFFIRYRVNGKQNEEGIGWASDGWNAKKASTVLSDLRKNHLTGEGAQTLSEQRAIQNEMRKAEIAEKKRRAKEKIAFYMYFTENYLPEAETNKTYDSWRREKNLVEYWIKPVIGKMAFKNIRPFHLERIKKNMREADKAPRSIQYALAVVRQVFNHAIKNEMFKGDNPATKVSKPKVDNKRERFLTESEADTLLAHLKTKSQQVHDIALISLHCGLRASEIFKLTWGKIDIDNGIITVKGKGGKTRPAFMTDKVKNLFANLPGAEPDDLIFKDQKGKEIKKISNSFQKTVDGLNLNKGVSDKRQRVVFHTLRHTYASWMVQNGENLYTVKELLGHSTLAMTERYSHLADDNLKSAVKRFEKRLKLPSMSVKEITPI